MTSWMLTRLKRETQSQLVIANNDRLSPLATPPTVDSYRAYLARIYGFESPVEAACARTPGLDELIDLRGRSQLRLLRADLQALGTIDSSVLPAAAIASFASPAEALGWLYAIDHNALMHGQVHRHLKKYLPRIIEVAGTYLDAGTRAVGARLQDFGAALDRCARDPDTARDIVDAATRALRRQHHWFATLITAPVDRRPTQVA